MERRIRGLALFICACFALIVLQLDNIQIRQAPALARAFPLIEPSLLSLPRGEIITADGIVIAKSIPSRDSEKELRVYPENSLYADVSGYLDVSAVSETGLEAEYDSYLSEHVGHASNLRQMLTAQDGTDTVVTTIVSSIQEAAAKALAPFASGSVVALDPRTGAVLALIGKPSFDPNTLAIHDPRAAANAYAALSPNSGTSPLINSAVGQIYNPGSTFKLITTSAMFDHDPRLASQAWKPESQTTLPFTRSPLQNFGGEVCGGTLAQILARSCDTAYALMGIDVGAPSMAKEAAAFGFNATPPIDLPSSEVASGCFPPVAGSSSNPDCPSGVSPIGGDTNKPFLAYSSIGQKDVKESALEDAMVVGAIADGGRMMTPHLMSRIVDEAGDIVTTYTPAVWKQATSAQTASAVLGLMLGVVTYGTAAGVGFDPTDHVAAKTGTAETGPSNCSTNWLVATAPAGPHDIPTVAVAAVVPSQAATACSETGAQAAGPVVKSVLKAALAAQR